MKARVVIGNRGTLLLVALLGLVVQTRASAAVRTNESFSSGMSSWRGGGSLVVTSLVSGMLRGQFASQTIPTPDSGSFVCTNISSGGSFTGNYAAAQIGLIGFSFMAQQVLPSEFVVRLYGPSGSFFRSLTNRLTSVGVWHHFLISLQDREQGGWNGGDEEAFQTALSDVRWLQIYVQRNGEQLQQFFLDDVFLASAPRAAAHNAENETTLQITWNNLLTGVVYRVESTPQDFGSWTVEAAFTASSASVISSIPVNTNIPASSFRLSHAETR